MLLHAYGLYEDLFPKLVKQEEDYDDVSLLPVPLVPEAEVEVGDVNLLAAAMCQYGVQRKGLMRKKLK